MGRQLNNGFKKSIHKPKYQPSDFLSTLSYDSSHEYLYKY